MAGCVVAVAIVAGPARLGLRFAARLLHRATTDAYLTPDFRLIMPDGAGLTVVDRRGSCVLPAGPGNPGIGRIGCSHGHFFGTLLGADPERAWFVVGQDTGSAARGLTETGCASGSRASGGMSR